MTPRERNRLNLPADVAAAVGLGDLVSAVAALVALVALRLRAKGAIALVWVFSVVGIADLVFATTKAVGVEMYRFPISPKSARQSRSHAVHEKSPTI